MSESGDAPLQRVKVREATGVLHARKSLEETIDDLQLAGFDRASVSLMASSEAVRDKLGEAYRPVGHAAAGHFADELIRIDEVHSSTMRSHGRAGAHGRVLTRRSASFVALALRSRAPDLTPRL